MRIKLFLGVFLFLLAIKIGYTNENQPMNFEDVKKFYSGNEKISFNLINNSESKIYYWVSPMKLIEGQWREIDPLDIEDPHHNKAVLIHSIKSKETKLIKWVPEKNMIISFGTYKFVIYYSKDSGNINKPNKFYSDKFEIKK